MPDRWCKARIQRVSGTPNEQSLAVDDAVEEDLAPHRGPGCQRDDGPDDDERAPRRMPILRRDLEKHGYYVRPHV